jgi:hypothetical protein
VSALPIANPMTGDPVRDGDIINAIAQALSAGIDATGSRPGSSS